MSYLKNFERKYQAVGYRPRTKQRQLWECVDGTEKQAYLGVMVTGYGKTEAAAGSYFILRGNRRVDRFLIVVPTDQQRTQFAEGMADIAASLGEELRIFSDPWQGTKKVICEVSGDPFEFRLAKTGQCEVFVTTIQHICYNQDYYHTLMHEGRWFTFFDEFHKLNVEDDSKWGTAAKVVWKDVVLGLTATPTRTDGSYHIFSNMCPDVEVGLQDAYDEKAIRGIVAHLEHYFVDCLDELGNPCRLKTEDLKNVSDFDSFLKKRRQLRLHPRYLADILHEAYDCLTRKNLRHPGEHQMVVFAMGQGHAKQASDLMNAIYGDATADWIGVSRTEDENTSVMTRYKAGEIKCLISVDKASEGFNHVRASVGVFLNLLTQNTVRLRQQAGRCMRRNKNIQNFLEDEADLFASPDTEIAEFLRELALLTVGDIKPPPPKGDENGGGGKLPPIFPIPDQSIINVEHDHSEIHRKVDEMLDEHVEAITPRLTNPGVDREVLAEELRRILIEMELERAKKTSAALDKAQEGASRTSVHDAANTYIGNVVRTYRLDKNKYFQPLAKRLHNNFGKATKFLLQEELQKKYKWIQNLNEEFDKTRTAPKWLMQGIAK